MIEILLALGIFIIGIFSIISVFPDAKSGVNSSEDKTIMARFADSLMHSIVEGARGFTEGKDAPDTITKNDVVYFTFELNDDFHQDFFVLPPNPTAEVDDPSDTVWFPCESVPDNWSTISYGSDVSSATPEEIAMDPHAGFKGSVRRLGRAALGSSSLEKDQYSTDEAYPERLKDFYFCFSITRAEDKKRSTPTDKVYFNNLFKISLYIYHGGVQPQSGAADQSPSKVYKLLDETSPVGKANNYMDHFDFLVNINKG